MSDLFLTGAEVYELTRRKRLDKVREWLKASPDFKRGRDYIIDPFTSRPMIYRVPRVGAADQAEMPRPYQEIYGGAA